MILCIVEFIIFKHIIHFSFDNALRGDGIFSGVCTFNRDSTGTPSSASKLSCGFIIGILTFHDGDIASGSASKLFDDACPL